MQFNVPKSRNESTQCKSLSRIYFSAKSAFLQFCMHLKGTVSSSHYEATYPNRKHQNRNCMSSLFWWLGASDFPGANALEMYVCTYVCMHIYIYVFVFLLIGHKWSYESAACVVIILLFTRMAVKVKCQ